jgi:tryptophanyl-tRNA synthetase
LVEKGVFVADNKIMKPVLISGIQPTGKLHLGNYLGVLKNLVELQNSGKYQCYFFVADLHALTEGPDPTNLKKDTLDLAASFLAVGLNPALSTIFLQSEIPAHTEAAWILNTITPMGELERMTQYKEKAKDFGKKSPNAGLFTYPTLMAADILLYNAEFVPVGEDQLQHLELARTLARKFNNRFGKTFTEPQAILTATPRLMSLDNPHKKMSKSHPAGCLFMDDPAEIIKLKIKRAVTDSGREIVYEPKRKPAISNLISIYAAFQNWPPKTVQMRFKNTSYAEFKEKLSDLVIKHLSVFQKNKKEIITNRSFLRVIAEGAKIAGEAANQKMLEIKKKIGLYF